MGAFFTNVQVFVGTESVATITSRLVDTITATASALKLKPCADDRVECTMDTIVVPGERWVCVYDQQTEAQDQKSLRELASALSRATHSLAVSVIVHDSDILALELFDDGKSIDQYLSDPEKIARGAWSPDQRGKESAWHHLIADSDSVDALRVAFDHRSLFAESTLELVSKVLGFENKTVGRGFKYATENKATIPANAVRLRFGSTGRVRQERPQVEQEFVRGEAVSIDELVLLSFGRVNWRVVAKRNTGCKLVNSIWSADGKSATLTFNVSDPNDETALRERLADSTPLDFIFMVKGDGRLMGLVSINGIFEGEWHKSESDNHVELTMRVLQEPQRAGVWNNVAYYPKRP